MFLPFHDDNPTRRIPLVTVALIAANVVIFLWSCRQPIDQQQQLAYFRGFVPAWASQLPDPEPIDVPIDTLVRDRRTGQTIVLRERIRIQTSTQAVLLSLLTCMFLHGGWLHLFTNMWFLWLFGNRVEDRLGVGSFLMLYLLGGLVGSGCHWLSNPQSVAPVIGASGAVATILGAYVITWPWARIHTVVLLIVFITFIRLPALVVLGIWFLLQLLQGMQETVVQGVAWWAHVGGFAAGLLLMPLLGKWAGVVDGEVPTEKTD